MKVPIYNTCDQARFYLCWKDAAPFKPAVVKYRVTERCNARCIMCSYWKKKKFEELPLELVTRVNEEISGLGTNKVLFSGGEPTMHRDIAEMVEDASKHGFETSMITNGGLLTKSLAERLIKAGLNRIDFSIDGPSPEIHDKIRGLPGLWNRAVQGIKNIQESAERRKVKLHTTVSSVVIPQNYRAIPKMVLFKQKYGIENIHMYPTRPYVGGQPTTQLALSEKQQQEFVEEIIPELRSNAEKTGMDKGKIEELLELTDPRNSVDFEKPCFLPLFHATVIQNGEVYPCCHAADQRDVTNFSMGDLTKQTFKEVWSGRDYKKFRALCSNHLPSICSQCIYIELNQALAETMSKQESFHEKQINENRKNGIYAKKRD